MSTALSAMRSSARATSTMRRPHARQSRSPREVEHLLDDGAVEVVDEVVELVELLGALRVAAREGVGRSLEHALAAAAHLLQRVAHRVRLRPVVAAHLHQLGDRHALVGHALEVARDARRRQDERDVAPGHDVADEQDLRVAVERDAESIDLVVGFDHALRDSRVVARQRVQDLAQIVADEVGDLDQPLFQEAWRYLSHALAELTRDVGARDLVRGLARRSRSWARSPRACRAALPRGSS